MISCDQHDYVEIACTFQYPLLLIMRSGEEIFCVARDTQLNEHREECIKVQLKGSREDVEADAQELIVLDDVSVMEACVENPHFQRVVFG